jgi:hypothetical protein
MSYPFSVVALDRIPDAGHFARRDPGSSCGQYPPSLGTTYDSITIKNQRFWYLVSSTQREYANVRQGTFFQLSLLLGQVQGPDGITLLVGTKSSKAAQQIVALDAQSRLNVNLDWVAKLSLNGTSRASPAQVNSSVMLRFPTPFMSLF